MHTPVLLKEVVEALDPKPGAFVIDGTINGGGHAQALSEKIGKKGMLLGVDWDPGAIERLKKDETRFSSHTHFEQGNYAELPEILKRLALGKADALLLDLGFSSEQIDTSGRGFSFRSSLSGGEPLDMRYNPNEGASAAEFIHTVREKELADIIYQYGEERYSRIIAKAIVLARKKKTIRTAADLAAAVENAVPRSYERGRIHPATRTFQALRIYINHELSNLSSLLMHLDQCVTSGGRVAIISFHSLEDRIVKQHFQKLAKEKKVSLLFKKPLLPSQKEQSANPRSRSAKLRAIQLV